MYELTNHAIERIGQRSQVKFTNLKLQVQSWSKSKIRNGVIVDTGSDDNTYIVRSLEHIFVIDKHTKKIVTYYKNNKECTENQFTKDFNESINMVVEKMYHSKLRELNKKEKELNILFHELSINKWNAKNPKIKNVIQSKIDKVDIQIMELMQSKYDLQVMKAINTK